MCLEQAKPPVKCKPFKAWKVLAYNPRYFMDIQGSCKRVGSMRWRTGPYSNTAVRSNIWMKACNQPLRKDEGIPGFRVFRNREDACFYASKEVFQACLDYKVVEVLCKGRCRAGKHFIARPGYFYEESVMVDVAAVEYIKFSEAPDAPE